MTSIKEFDFDEYAKIISSGEKDVVFKSFEYIDKNGYKLGEGGDEYVYVSSLLLTAFSKNKKGFSNDEVHQIIDSLLERNVDLNSDEEFKDRDDSLKGADLLTGSICQAVGAISDEQDGLKDIHVSAFIEMIKYARYKGWKIDHKLDAGVTPYVVYDSMAVAGYKSLEKLLPVLTCTIHEINEEYESQSEDIKDTIHLIEKAFNIEISNGFERNDINKKSINCETITAPEINIQLYKGNEKTKKNANSKELENDEAHGKEIEKIFRINPNKYYCIKDSYNNYYLTGEYSKNHIQASVALLSDIQMWFYRKSGSNDNCHVKDIDDAINKIKEYSKYDLIGIRNESYYENENSFIELISKYGKPEKNSDSEYYHNVVVDTRNIKQEKHKVYFVIKELDLHIDDLYLNNPVSSASDYGKSIKDVTLREALTQAAILGCTVDFYSCHSAGGMIGVKIDKQGNIFLGEEDYNCLPPLDEEVNFCYFLKKSNTMIIECVFDNNRKNEHDKTYEQERKNFKYKLFYPNEWEFKRDAVIKYLGFNDEVIVPQNATSIESGAIEGPGVKRIYLPSNNIKIKSNAFKNCNNLELIEVYDTGICGRPSIPLSCIKDRLNDIKYVNIKEIYDDCGKYKKNNAQYFKGCTAEIILNNRNVPLTYKTKFPIKIGDFVTVTGKLSNRIGVIVNFNPAPKQEFDYEWQYIDKVINPNGIDGKIRKELEDKLAPYASNCIIYSTCSTTITVKTKNENKYVICKYPVWLNDKVKVLDINLKTYEGEVVAIDELSEHAYYTLMDELDDDWEKEEYDLGKYKRIGHVFEINGKQTFDVNEVLNEINGTQNKINEVKQIRKDFATPLVIDDDYPFGYEIDASYNKLINDARSGDKNSIKELIKLYGDTNSDICNERKEIYWKKKAGK